MQSKAPTVAAYLASLPADRRADLERVRAVIRANLDPSIEEGMQYGMIGYFIPHSVFPPGYHCDPRQPLGYAGLGSQKNHMALYLMCIYGQSDLHKQFASDWAKTGKRLDMGKACIRFKSADDLALDVIGATIKRVTAQKYLDQYAKALASMGKDITGKKIAPAKRATASKPAKKGPAPAKPKIKTKANAAKTRSRG